MIEFLKDLGVGIGVLSIFAAAAVLGVAIVKYLSPLVILAPLLVWSAWVIGKAIRR